MGDGEGQRAGQFAASPVQGVEAWAAANILPGHLPHHHFGIGIDVQFLRFESNGVLQSFHERGIFRDVVILVADPFGDAYRAGFAAVDNNSNARRPGISQATAIHVSHQLGHHDFCFCLHDALIRVLRQDDYLIPYHHFAVDPRLVHFTVQNWEEFAVATDKILPDSYLHSPFFTG
jgi:hypothetical protein